MPKHNYTLETLPYGSVIRYRKQIYFKSDGLNADILPDRDGHWRFIHEAKNKWKTFHVLFVP